MNASTLRHAAAIAACLVALSATRALAQPKPDNGFKVRELSVSTGYALVDLPPITLAGYLPQQVLEQDLVTSGTAAIGWQHATHRTLYSMSLFGTYTARTRYSELSSPGANLSFGVTRALGRRWQFGAGIASGMASSDQLATQSSSARQLIDDSASFGDLAGAVSVRSPHPDLAQAALFVPISQSFDASEINGTRTLVGSAKVGGTYTHSVRLSTHFQGAFTTVRDISSYREERSDLTAVDADSRSFGVGVNYGPSERTQVTADFGWSQTSGIATNKLLSGSVGYGWTGRKWFARGTVGVGVRPFKIPDGGTAETSSRGAPVPIYSGAIGYKFGTQTVLFEYSRSPHDDFGNGGRNLVTGFEGDVQAGTGAWSWTPPRGRWMARADFSLTRRPGNFSYINAWLGTAGIGRQVGTNFRVMGEFLFDRHGSRSFESFYLTRQSFRINLAWSPSRRAIEPESSAR